MNLTRRDLLTSLPAIFALPLFARSAPTTSPHSEALEWVLGQLNPGTLIVVQADIADEAFAFMDEVKRTAPWVLSAETVRPLRKAALRLKLPGIITARTNDWDAIRAADIVVFIDQGQMRVIKHRIEAWDRPAMAT